MTNQQSPIRRFMVMFSIIFAAELIFSLPFHIPRFFLPTVMNVFDLSGAQLGDIFAFYGITATLAYFPGGLIADKFNPRNLMCISLFTTAIGGLFLAQLPSHNTLTWIYAFWGASTIFLFWAPMITVTRAWGGTSSQGKAFGLLDGGRGLLAAAISSIVVFAFSAVLPTEVDQLSHDERSAALQTVIYLYTSLTLLAAVLVWLFVPKPADAGNRAHARPPFISSVIEVVKLPTVWYQGGIVLAAYCAFKGLDFYPLYATRVLGFNEVESATAASSAAYLRPLGALVAGVLADKFGASRMILLSFITLVICYGLLSLINPQNVWIGWIYANILLTFFVAYALRGIYFALLEETKIKGYLTGTSVGIISFIGFTPDIFFAPIAGRILDAGPGSQGFANFFTLIVVICAMGLVLSYLLVRKVKAQAN
ncbi:MAG: nitrate/nitrite transporter NarK [Phenylobacterium sp.]|jgi:nitrate/nitrite transporter NarK